jgi:hypothetical protein
MLHVSHSLAGPNADGERYNLLRLPGQELALKAVNHFDLS